MARQAAYEHTMRGRAEAELQEWAEQEQTKGQFALIGALWQAHPSWGPDPKSLQYAESRWKWHQNLGELLDFHGSAHIRARNVNGVVRKHLVVTLTHDDLPRLAAVQVVTGGSIDNHFATGQSRLRIENRGGFMALKAGRRFINPDNRCLFAVINAAMRFHTHVPEPGVPPTDAQIYQQDEEETHLIPLLTAYQALGKRSHTCAVAVSEAGGGDMIKRRVFY